MTTPLSSFSGLISGFNSTDLVDAIIAQARQPAANMETQISANNDKETALGSYRILLDTLRSAATALRDGSALDSTTATVNVLTGTKALASVATTSAAGNGSYTLTVQNLAKAEKLSSTGSPSATTALGQTGTFTVNGQNVAVTSSDTLTTLRDKINKLNSGGTPTGVSASILTISPTDSRLVLTSAATGAAGIGLVDTSGTVLQSLGYLDNTGAKTVAATLVGGADAHFTIDSIPLTRTSNTVDDAIEGVTLTLTGDEAGASTQINVAHSADAASAAMQKFVDAYNDVVNFIKTESTPSDSGNPALYGDSILRTIRSGLPSLLLQAVGSAAPDLATMSTVGISLTRDGTVTFDSDKFKAAYTTRFDDVKALFTEELNATGDNLTFASSGGNTTEGTRAINITSVATKATTESLGFSGTYDDGGTADTITIRDEDSGKSVDVQLNTGMTTSDIVQAFQSAFDANGLGITASADGNDVKFTQNAYGSRPGITIVTSGTGDGGSELWNTAGSTTFGTDVVGTINGQAATGSGQTLVGNSDTSEAGITIRYTGAATGAIGSVDLGLGSGARIERLLNSFLDAGTGILDSRVSNLDQRTASLKQRVSDFDERLERRRAVLLASFADMETAIARLKQQSTSLLGTTASTSSLSSSTSSS